MKSLISLDIAREKFDSIFDIQNRISHEMFVAFIEKHRDYFIWNQETERGKAQVALARDSEGDAYDPQKNLLHHRHLAEAEYLPRRDVYAVSVQHNSVGKVSLNVLGGLKNRHLVFFLQMAQELDALLLNLGRRVIDQKFVDSLPD